MSGDTSTAAPALSIIKLGGAAITDASGPDGLNLAVVERLAVEIRQASAHTRIILVHGTGAVGKPPAIEFGFVDKGALPKESAAVSCDIHRRLRSLNQRLVEVLIKAGLPAIGIDPALVVSADLQNLRGDQARSFLADLVRHGVLPVLYGDMVPQPNGDFRVLSSDVIACLLAVEFKADNLIFLSNIRGVYATPQHHESAPILDEITPRDLQRSGLFGVSDASDVSGGMGAKIQMALAASRHCRTCWLGSGLLPGLLPRFFEDGTLCGTRIRGNG